MPNSVAATLHDHIEAAEASLEALEIELLDAPDEPAAHALRELQSAYRTLIATARDISTGLA